MTLQVGECCCCPNLETGAKFIGAIEILLGILSILWGILSVIKSEYTALNPAAHIQVLDILLIVHGVFCALGGVVLLMGVSFKNIRYLERFLVLLLLNIIVFIAAVGVQIYIIAEFHRKIPSGVIIGCVVIDVVVEGFKIYFWIVIFSMYNYVKGVGFDVHELDSKTSIYAKWKFTPNARPL